MILSFVFGFASAQQSYFGASFKPSFLTGAGFNDLVTGFTVHYGGQVANDFDLRGGAEIIVTGIPSFSLNFDAFYRIPTDDMTIYVGAGADAGFGLSGDFGLPLMNVHAVIGFEYALESAAVFVELQPAYYVFGFYGVSGKVGFNLY